MARLRAYALAVAEVRGVVGATRARADRLRAVATQAVTQTGLPSPPPTGLGPIHLRVPGTPVLPIDGPTPADLEVLLAGTPVAPARATATWHLLETIVAGLAWSSTDVADDLPPGLLAPVAVALPPLDGRGVGWCPLEAAAAVPGLQDWLAGSGAWSAAAVRAGRPAPDLVVLGT